MDPDRDYQQSNETLLSGKSGWKWSRLRPGLRGNGRTMPPPIDHDLQESVIPPQPLLSAMGGGADWWMIRWIERL